MNEGETLDEIDKCRRVHKAYLTAGFTMLLCIALHGFTRHHRAHAENGYRLGIRVMDRFAYRWKYPDNGHRHRCSQGFEHDHARCIRCENDRNASFLLQVLRRTLHARQKLGRRLSAIWETGTVGEIKHILLGKSRTYPLDNGVASDSGIKDADWTMKFHISLFNLSINAFGMDQGAQLGRSAQHSRLPRLKSHERSRRSVPNCLMTSVCPPKKRACRCRPSFLLAGRGRQRITPSPDGPGPARSGQASRSCGTRGARAPR